MINLRPYSIGLISLLSACTPKTSIIYMGSEMNNPNLVTYSISDSDNRIKREILETEGDVKIPRNIKEKLMAEVDQRGLVVKINELQDMMNISLFFPIL